MAQWLKLSQTHSTHRLACLIHVHSVSNTCIALQLFVNLWQTALSCSTKVNWSKKSRPAARQERPVRKIRINTFKWLWRKNWNRKNPLSPQRYSWGFAKQPLLESHARAHTFQHRQQKTQIPFTIGTPWENGKDNAQCFWRPAVPKSVAPNPSIAGACSWLAPPAKSQLHSNS